MIIDRQSALRAWSLVSSVVPARTPKPVLQNVRAECGNGSIVFAATDLEVSVSCPVAGDPGATTAILLPADRFGAILKTATEDSIHIEDEDGKLVVQCLRSKFTLPSADPDEYPAPPEWDRSVGHFFVDAGSVRRAIRRTIFATDAESTRYALGGVLFELSPRKVQLVATDGRRLAVAVAAHFVEEVPDWSLSGVVPIKALKLIERACSDAENVGVSINAKSILVRTDDGVTVHSRLVEGRFPRYQDVFPGTHRSRVTVAASDLRRGVEQAAIATTDESRGVNVDVGDGVMALSAQSADVGSSDVRVPVGHEGEPARVAFDHRYLAEVCRALEDTDVVTIKLIDGKHAAVIEADDYQHVLVPLTRDS